MSRKEIIKTPTAVLKRRLCPNAPHISVGRFCRATGLRDQILSQGSQISFHNLATCIDGQRIRDSLALSYAKIMIGHLVRGYLVPAQPCSYVFIRQSWFLGRFLNERANDFAPFLIINAHDNGI